MNPADQSGLWGSIQSRTFSGQNQIIRDEAAGAEYSQAQRYRYKDWLVCSELELHKTLPASLPCSMGSHHWPNLPPSTDDVGVDKNKATYVLLVARENSLRVTLQTCTIWAELVGLDVLGLWQIEVLGIQLHPGHQTASRSEDWEKQIHKN